MDITLLVEACISGQRQAADIERAVQTGANLNNFSGPTCPLSRAVQAQRPDIVSTLLRLKADPNIPDSKGVSPLHMAVFDGAPETIQYLLQSKADVDMMDRVGQTPLFFAPHAQACEQLGRARCNPNVKNLKGQTALHLAAHAGLNETVLWLAKNMSRDAINAQDEEGRTAVWCAALANLKPTIALLQEHGADVTLRPHKVTQAKSSTNTRTSTPTKNRGNESTMSNGSTSGRNSASGRAKFQPPAQEQQRREWRDDQSRAPQMQTPQNKPTQREGWLTTSNEKGISFESISPKRDTQELRHLQDESPHQDHEVLSVLQTTLKEPSTSTTMTPAPQSSRQEAYFSPTAAQKGWLSSAPLFANAPPTPLQTLPESYTAVTESTDLFLSGKEEPRKIEPPALLPFATYYNANIAPSPADYLSRLHGKFGTKCNPAYPDLPDVKSMESAIRKIQTIQRGRVERTRAQITRRRNTIPIAAVETNGAAVWEIVLSKRDSKSKYGFWHDNAKVEFAKEYAKALSVDIGDDSAMALDVLAPAERPEALVIKRIVKKGLLEEWNYIHPEAEVIPGDRIISVNGATSIMDMQKELRSASITCKVLRPPEIFNTELVKSGQQRKLGFKFEKPANSEVLRITEIVKDGLLDEVNRTHMKNNCHHLVILPGMRIEAANEVAQDCSRILEMIKRNDTVQLQIRRNLVVKATEHTKSGGAAPPPPLGT